MRKSEIYFDQAQQADRLAARVRNPIQKTEIRQMAQAWRRMAFDAQAREDDPTPRAGGEEGRTLRT